MKHILFSFFVGICLFLTASADLHAKACKSVPAAFYYSRVELQQDEFLVAWVHSTPVIYFHARVATNSGVSETLMIAAEFDKFQEAWVFYGQVPVSLVKMVHKKWKIHRASYQKCLGDTAWQNKQYYYSPYRSDYSSHPTYNWMAVGPNNRSNAGRMIILKPQLKIKPRHIIIKNPGTSTKEFRKLKRRIKNKKL